MKNLDRKVYSTGKRDEPGIEPGYENGTVATPSPASCFELSVLRKLS